MQKVVEAVNEEIYISVDIEAAGPIPGQYSMLSLGACIVGNAGESFYVELKPINKSVVPEAISVSNLNLEVLEANGRDPAAAMAQLRTWIGDVSKNGTPVFVGFNATFDWSFVNWYFHRFLGENPFGFGGIDIKSYYMGFSGCSWNETRSSRLPPEFQQSEPLTHNALDDARAQASVFQRMLTARSIKLDDA